MGDLARIVAGTVVVCVVTALLGTLVLRLVRARSLLWSIVVAALVPLLARRCNIDPALVSAPLISTLVDATGLFIFYSVAIVLLIKVTSH